MKKMFVIAVLLIGALSTPNAEAIYLGELPEPNGYSVDAFDMDSKMAVTVYFISSRGRLELDRFYVLQPDANRTATSGQQPIPRGALRVIISLHTVGGTATVVISGNTFFLGTQHGEVVFDVIR